MANKTKGLRPPRYATAATVDDFARNAAAVRAGITAAAERVGRHSSDVKLLPVSKTVGESRLRLAAQAGFTELGENKVQEAARKHENLQELGLKWSVIGHLQSNKVPEVVTFASEFQALDSLRLAEVLDRRLQQAGLSLNVYVQVNTSAEPQKYGICPDELPKFIADLAVYQSLNIRGLMTLAVTDSDANRVRDCFKLLRTLRDRTMSSTPELIGPGELSMGMSSDYQIAVEEGSTVVRVGQAIFGSRATSNAHYWPRSYWPGAI